LYDEDYIEYHARKVRKDLDDILKMSDSELLKLLEGIPEEETMRALGYTKKEGNYNES
jgi:hypothetical protein